MFEADILKRQNFYDLPSDSKQLDFIKDNTFKNEDPSQIYEVVSRIDKGTFGLIFKAKRKSDEKLFALKFMQPKTA
jgi:23S rRNA-/tRNA-specific pseudouridylate synthase